MDINIISDQRTNLISPLSVPVKQKTRVIQLPNTTSTTSLTNKMLLIAGLVTATGILFLNNYASQNAKIAADLHKNAKVAANWHKECIVALNGNQDRLYRANKLKIVECHSLLANQNLVEIYCGEEFVNKTTNHPNLHNLNCEGTINDEVKFVGVYKRIVPNEHRYRYAGCSITPTPLETLPGILRKDLSDPDKYSADFMISKNCDTTDTKKHCDTSTIRDILLDENSMWRKTDIFA